jgi:hypothetical protein
MRELIRRNLDGKKVLFLFLITNVVYAIMLTITIPHVMNFSGGIKLLDMMPTGYNTEYVNSLFSALGENGRNAYLFHQLPVDMIYPFLFAISSCLVLAYFLNKLNRLGGVLFYLCFIPLFSGVFDYSENIGIISMLNFYPNHSDLMIKTTSIFSVLKSSCTISYFIILTIFIVSFGVTTLNKRNRVTKK